MVLRAEDMNRELERIFRDFPTLRASDIPGIDLYMDQVTTFLQENLRGLSRDPEGDKFLTKTMINNYVKNKVLMPPVKKKYSRDHMMLLIMIYYMKSFLSIGDIRDIMAPLIGLCAAQDRDHADKRREGASPERKKADPPLRIRDVYDHVTDGIEKELPRMQGEIEQELALAVQDFPELPEEERALLQRFSLICRLSAGVYVRKLFIEKLLDREGGE